MSNGAALTTAPLCYFNTQLKELAVVLPFVSTGGRPWLNLCLTAYSGEDENGHPQTCYQVLHSKVNRTFSTQTEQDPA